MEMLRITILSCIVALLVGFIVGGVWGHYSTKLQNQAIKYQRVEDVVIVLPEEYRAITRDTLIAKAKNDTIYLEFTGKHR